MLKQKRIPTLIGLFILLAGLGAGVFLVTGAQNFFLRAGPTAVPKEVEITNINDSGFTVSWITDEPVSGFIQYGEAGLNQTAIDERDLTTGETGSFSTHYVSVKNAKPATTYQFKVGSGAQTYDDDGQNFRVTTAPTISLSAPEADPAYGTILTATGETAGGVIVYLTLDNASPLSALVGSSGNWVVSLSLARSTDLSRYAAYDPEEALIAIFVQGGDLGTASATVTAGQASPVPTIALGQTYDFQAKEKPSEGEALAEAGLPAEQEAEATAGAEAKTSFSLTEEEKEAAVETELSIVNPGDEEAVSSDQPAIVGTAPAGTTVTITVESPDPQAGQVVADEDGNWQWSPPDNLTPGEHTVTATYIDASGQQQTVSRTFIVLAAGESELPSIEATPSATTAPTPTPTLLAQATPTPSPTASPTATPTASPTATPTASPVATGAALPEAGSVGPTLWLTLMGLGALLAGALLKLLTKTPI